MDVGAIPGASILIVVLHQGGALPLAQLGVVVDGGLDDATDITIDMLGRNDSKGEGTGDDEELDQPFSREPVAIVQLELHGQRDGARGMDLRPAHRGQGPRLDLVNGGCRGTRRAKLKKLLLSNDGVTLVACVQ